MVVDSSALVAIVFNEPEAEQFRIAVSEATICFISAASVLEASMVVEGRRGDQAGRALDAALHDGDIEVVPVTLEQIDVARSAFRQFGRGRHKAGLNFGDCFSYALAKVSGEPLLHKGNDFSQTDLATVSLPPSPQNT
ncbi:MAG: type II toxin-antitoxin system VapC family toxin [Bryobacteraceae bacterium]|jgi:ribonuclease VapC